MKAKVKAAIEQKIAEAPLPEELDDRTKVTIVLPIELIERIKTLCSEFDLYLHVAYTTGMQNWVSGMEGRAGFRPIYQPDHDALEDILRANKPEAVAAVRAVMAALKPPAAGQ